MAVKECLHPSGWRKGEKCDTCRYRNALERIMMMTVRDYNPTSREGRMIEKAVEVAGYALYPEWEKRAAKEK